MYGVSRLFVKREIRHLIPILFVKLNYIRWAGEFDAPLHGVHAVIDCSSHPRLPVHPGSADSYRGEINDAIWRSAKLFVVSKELCTT
jgi:hypothetical protein